MTVIEVKVYFDILCPWCYIGQKSVDQAISLYKRTYPGGSNDDFVFTYLPYYLNPTLPAPGIPWEEVVARKNGEERVNAIRTRLQRVGRANGIEFKFETVGNTRDAHRLVQSVRKRDPMLQKSLVESIYRAHFEQGLDPSSHDDLAQAAVAAGMSSEEVRDFLGSGEGGEETDEMAARSRKEGINSVPTVYIGTQRLEGAEDVSTFYEAFVAVKGEA